MAPAVPPLAFALLLFLLGCSRNRKVHGVDEGFEVLGVETMMPAPFCTISEVPSKNALRVVHRHGPCFPSSGSKLDDDQIFSQDLLRAAYLQNRIRLLNATRNTRMDGLQESLQETVRLPTRSGNVMGSGGYVITIGIGTPPRNQTVEFDTGSHMCWVQCRPCQSCYQQQDPIFDPATSHTYRNITCDDPACTALPVGSRNCTDNTCVYRVRYGDGSNTAGFLAMEKLTIGETNFVIPNFVLGCGHANRLSTTSSRVAGIFGLARGLQSLVTQGSSRLGKVFSYCLPSTVSSTGYLIIGRSRAPRPSYTPMRRRGPPQYPDLYYIDLEGISVGPQRLPLSPSIFQGVGTIMDSGTVVSRLPTAAYAALREAFRHGMSQYRMVAPFSILDTCYDISNLPDVRYPHITLHFSGADLLLTPQQIFSVFNPTVTCLAFTAAQTGAVGIIGNMQQRGMEVIYDIPARRIGFSRGINCP